MFDKLLGILMRDKTEHLAKGLGVTELPATIYTEKQPIKSSDFKVFVNEIFFPKIQELGFKGKDFFYYKENDIYTEAVFFWTFKAGGAIQVDLLVKFNNIVDPTLNKPIKPKDVRPDNAEFFHRLSESNKKTKFIPDSWFWVFREKDEDNRKLVNDIWRVFSYHRLDFFERFKNHREYIGRINRMNYLDFPDFQIQRYFGKFEFGILYFLFEYWRQLGDNEKASEFAKISLDKISNKIDTRYLTVFKEYFAGNK